jgi:acetylglutamate kinase
MFGGGRRDMMARPPQGDDSMIDAVRKVEALIEALGYIRTFRDRLTVIKLGGSAMEEPDALEATLQDVIFMETAGMRPILVHGGGKAIDRAMASAGLQPRKILGRRYTDPATLNIVVRTLLDETNADIVAQIRRLGGRAVGLHSASLQCLFGQRLTLPGPEGELIDLGLVGTVSRVDGAIIQDLCAARVVPVIPSLAIEEDDSVGQTGMSASGGRQECLPHVGQTGMSASGGRQECLPHVGGWLNVNADTAAAAVAAHLRAEKLVFLTDTPGILLDRHNDATLLPSLDAAGCQDLIARGVIDSGMIPKVEACLDSLRAGVRKTHMIDGRQRHALLLEIYTHSGVGTEITLGHPGSQP